VHGAAGWLKPGVPRALLGRVKGMRQNSGAETPRENANGCLKSLQLCSTLKRDAP
jgi:hypothetical protein